MREEKITLPIVDILICTYNHERYLGQAIESVISQTTNFKTRILIGDDASTDNTREIIEEYVKKYPSIIFPYYRQSNIGAHLNSSLLLEECRSKYIASVEGDDYWSDPYKLQKQVDFLEANPDYALCYHHVKVIQESDFRNQKLEMKKQQPETSTIAEILKLSIWAHMNSVVFRNSETLRSMPGWFTECPSGDWALLAIITGDKKIKYFSETMSVYRQHGGGIWSSNAKIQNQLNILNTAKILNKHLVKKNERKYIYWPMHYSYLELINYYKSLNYLKSLRYSFLSAILNLKYTLITKRERASELSWKEIIQKSIKALKNRFIPKLL